MLNIFFWRQVGRVLLIIASERERPSPLSLCVCLLSAPLPNRLFSWQAVAHRDGTPARLARGTLQKIRQSRPQSDATSAKWSVNRSCGKRVSHSRPSKPFIVITKSDARAEGHDLISTRARRVGKHSAYDSELWPARFDAAHHRQSRGVAVPGVMQSHARRTPARRRPRSAPPTRCADFRPLPIHRASSLGARDPC